MPLNGYLDYVIDEGSLTITMAAPFHGAGSLRNKKDTRRTLAFGALCFGGYQVPQTSSLMDSYHGGVYSCTMIQNILSFS